MSNRVGWRLRKKRRLSLLRNAVLIADKREEKPVENKNIEMKRLAAERYIRSIGG